jgi:hypothetical protein
MALKTPANPTESDPTHAAAHDREALAQLVFPPALSAGLNINETIRYSCAFSALFLVFVLADAGLNSFMGSILFKMEKWKTAPDENRADGPRGGGGLPIASDDDAKSRRSVKSSLE